MVRFFSAFILSTLIILFAPQTAQAAEPTTQDFDDWRMVCETVEKKERCRAFQRLSIKQGDKTQVMMIASIGYIEDGKAGRVPTLRLTTPLGVVLPAGLAVNVDKGEKENLPYHICLPDGCMTEIGLSDKGIADMRRGRAMHVVYRAAGIKQPVAVQVSLKGFTAAYNALTNHEKKP